MVNNMLAHKLAMHHGHKRRSSAAARLGLALAGWTVAAAGLAGSARNGNR